MSKKKTLLLAAGALVTVGAFAAVYAQGHRGHGWGGHMQMGEDGMGPGMGMRGRFGGALTKDEFDARSRERFARLDRNNDGFIDQAEIEAQMSDRMGRRGMGGPGGQGMMPGSQMLRMHDANRDGKVTKDEFQAGIRKRFAEADLNNDGKITDEDLPPMMRGHNVLSGGGMSHMLGGRGGRHGMGTGFPLLQMLRNADANKDGSISLDEVLTASEARFATFDRTKDGQIDQADFDQLRKEMADYRVKRFIHHFGADKDGKVSREQFTAKASERFAQMDLNNDGTVARDERPGGGFGRHMRNRMGGGMGHDPMHERGGMGRHMGPMMGPEGGPAGPAKGPAPAPAQPK